MKEPHPNEKRSATERQRLHTHNFGDAEPRESSVEYELIAGRLFRKELPRIDSDQSERLLSRDRDDCGDYQEIEP